MSVRKREWKTPRGETKEAWVVDYVDGGGTRRQKTFARKRDADAHHARVNVDVRDGVHTAERASPTVKEAGELWLKTGEAEELERATQDVYRQHLTYHIAPFLGALRLSELTVPRVRTFQDELRREGRSPAMVRKAITSLGSILADAQERGLVRQNVVRSLRKRKRGKERKRVRRQTGKLKVGVHIPTPAEIKTLIPHLKDRWKPLLLTAIFTGLRSSELRGLRWVDVNLKAGEIHVRQRADRFDVIGPPKSEDGERTVPIDPKLIAILKEWKLACPIGELGLVFPTRAGAVENHANIVHRGLQPAMIAAGLTKDGKAKYTGLHALRHFYASWCINRRVDGGRELPLKVVQVLMGHSSIQITADTYGHLFPQGDDSAELAAAVEAFF